MFINKKACKVRIKELEAQASKDFWAALDAKLDALMQRAVTRANGHRLTPLTLQELNGKQND